MTTRKISPNRRIRLVAVLAVLAASGCGSGNGPVIPGAGILLPTFDSIQVNLLTPQCTNCHVGATAPLGLRLDEANSYALLVGRASVQNSALLRVDPGNPDASYLIRKLEGTASVGGQMPLGAPPLPQADINVIRQWISNGALPGGGAMPTTPIRVSSLDPMPGSTVPMLPMSVTAIFDRELNANSVDTTTFLVERSGGDGTFGDGNEVAITPASVTVPQVNPRTAVFDMSTTTPVEDTYRVTLIGTGPATIQDLSANRLDGEFSGTFPSGDGTAGGNFVADFVVEGVQPTLQSIQDNVFTPICAGCHSGPTSND
ncbi:MAG: Ig-like domain-containing protein, partial [Gammaproteobacteria bacterium]|nr:Ig-like domain-containing protein [Gammaproteobacteria bacterium]